MVTCKRKWRAGVPPGGWRTKHHSDVFWRYEEADSLKTSAPRAPDKIIELIKILNYQQPRMARRTGRFGWKNEQRTWISVASGPSSNRRVSDLRNWGQIWTSKMHTTQHVYTFSDLMTAVSWHVVWCIPTDVSWGWWTISNFTFNLLKIIRKATIMRTVEVSQGKPTPRLDCNILQKRPSSGWSLQQRCQLAAPRVTALGRLPCGQNIMTAGG